MILNCWTTFAKKHLVFWSFSTLTCIPHKIKYFIISHTAWPVQFSSAATASADNSWIHKGFSQSSKVYFVIFNILKDVQIIQTIQTFFFFFPVADDTQAKESFILSPPFISRTQTSVSSGSPRFPLHLHLHLLLTDCFCHCSELLPWLLAGVVFLNYQQKNQTQTSGNTYNPNQPDSVLA